MKLKTPKESDCQFADEIIEEIKKTIQQNFKSNRSSKLVRIKRVRDADGKLTYPPNAFNTLDIEMAKVTYTMGVIIDKYASDHIGVVTTAVVGAASELAPLFIQMGVELQKTIALQERSETTSRDKHARFAQITEDAKAMTRVFFKDHPKSSKQDCLDFLTKELNDNKKRGKYRTSDEKKEPPIPGEKTLWSKVSSEVPDRIKRGGRPAKK